MKQAGTGQALRSSDMNSGRWGPRACSGVEIALDCRTRAEPDGPERDSGGSPRAARSAHRAKGWGSGRGGGRGRPCPAPRAPRARTPARGSRWHVPASSARAGPSPPRARPRLEVTFLRPGIAEGSARGEVPNPTWPLGVCIRHCGLLSKTEASTICKSLLSRPCFIVFPCPWPQTGQQILDA